MSKDIIMVVHGTFTGINGLPQEKDKVLKTGKLISEYKKNRTGVVYSGHSIASRDTAKLFKNNLHNIINNETPPLDALNIGGFLWSKKMLSEIRQINDNIDFAVLIIKQPHLETLANVAGVVLPDNEFLGFVYDMGKNWKSIKSSSTNNLKAIMMPDGFKPLHV